MKTIKKKELEQKLRKVLEDYIVGLGYPKEDVDEWLIIDIKNFKNDYGDEGVHIQIRNEFVGYFELPEEINKKLDEIVAPAYFEPYDPMVWDAYMWDVKLEDDFTFDSMEPFDIEKIKRELDKNGYSEPMFIGIETIDDGPSIDGEGYINIVKTEDKEGPKYHAEHWVENEASQGPIEDPEYITESLDTVEEVIQVLKEEGWFSAKDSKIKDEESEEDKVTEAEYESLIRHANHGQIVDVYEGNNLAELVFEETYKKLGLPEHDEWVVHPDVLKDDELMEKFYQELRKAVIKELNNDEYCFDTSHDEYYGEHEGTREIMELLDIKKHMTFDSGKYVYQFPSTMTRKDMEEAKKYGLEYLGKVSENGFQAGDFLVKGTIKELKKFCREYLDYQLHPDYLYKEEDIALDEILVKDELEDKSDSTKLMDLIGRCKEILRRGLVEEGYEDEGGDEIFFNADFKVLHEKDGEQDKIILIGDPEKWQESEFEEDIANEIEEEIQEEYPTVDLKWFDNSAGCYWILKE